MKILKTPAEVTTALGGRRSIAVPTMGNLHDGHLSLIRRAHEYADGGNHPVLATLFVNRLQFAPHEDFDQYPRTFERDCELLREQGCELLFAPDESVLYPQPQAFHVTPDPELAGKLEGEFRPRFFTGVCTVVTKLFNCVSPRAAVFGKKDYQQFLVLRQMVRQLNMPIELVAGETRREASGLAMSSRNHYLSDAEKRRAAGLYRQMCVVRDALASGADASAAIADALSNLKADGWRPDYLSLHDRNTLDGIGEPADHRGEMVLLAAAHLGSVRLIDSLEL